MKKLICAGLLPFLLAFPCMSQTQESLCPKHIETPEYASIARTAHISGVVVMTLTIDAEGKVSDVKVRSESDTRVSLSQAHRDAGVCLNRQNSAHIRGCGDDADD